MPHCQLMLQVISLSTASSNLASRSLRHTVRSSPRRAPFSLALHSSPESRRGLTLKATNMSNHDFSNGHDFSNKDKLILRGLQFHGFHGVKPEEKKLGQKFLIEVDAWLDLNEAGKTDNISNTVSYTDIYRIAKDVVEGPSQNLLESVAHLIANTTLLKFPQISAVRVKVGKPHVAVQGPVDYLGVEIMRYQKA